MLLHFDSNKDLQEMARVGWVPLGTTKNIEVYVHTDDSGDIPHFHVRKYEKKTIISNGKYVLSLNLLNTLNMEDTKENFLKVLLLNLIQC